MNWLENTVKQARLYAQLLAAAMGNDEMTTDDLSWFSSRYQQVRQELAEYTGWCDQELNRLTCG